MRVILVQPICSVEVDEPTASTESQPVCGTSEPVGANGQILGALAALFQQLLPLLLQLLPLFVKPPVAPPSPTPAN